MLELKPKPPVKWAGGKARLIPQFEPLFPKKKYGLYIEPFVGGGAVFFIYCLLRLYFSTTTTS
nr:DNA adenine methylase [Moorella glycerini]